MIYTLTLNPAVDYVVHIDDIQTGRVNRLQRENIFFGGKGINVSWVLSELGISSKALGFVAGFTGDAIEKGIREKGIETDFVHLAKGFSRINVKIHAKEETELNGKGPEVSKEELSELFDKLQYLQNGDMLVLAGSIPSTLPYNIYEEILETISDKAIRIVADAAGELLFRILKYHPFLVKPNHHELAELFQTEITSEDEIVYYARKLKAMGAENVLVSMAGEGALLIDEWNAVHRMGVYRGTVINSVGAGDSMVAGFLSVCERSNGGIDYDNALKLGTAAGGATAFSEGLATRERIQALLNT